jgi:DNA-directed RNA polymerase specialized sigma24 family protein
VRSPRSEREARRRQIQWREPHDDEIASLGACGVWEEMDAIAAAARLTADEKAVVSMECVEERSIRDMAGRLGVTVHRVRRLRRSARLKLGRCSEVPTSVRSLFHEEVEQKKASIYRAPVHTWRTRRTRGDER